MLLDWIRPVFNMYEQSIYQIIQKLIKVFSHIVSKMVVLLEISCIKMNMLYTFVFFLYS